MDLIVRMCHYAG